MALYLHNEVFSWNALDSWFKQPPNLSPSLHPLPTDTAPQGRQISMDLSCHSLTDHKGFSVHYKTVQGLRLWQEIQTLTWFFCLHSATYKLCPSTLSTMSLCFHHLHLLILPGHHPHFAVTQCVFACSGIFYPLLKSCPHKILFFNYILI